MWNLIRWDLGPSFKYEGRTVNDIINSGFPVSAILGVTAVALALLLGIPAGVLAALKQNKWPDTLAMLAATVGVSVPSFIMATFLMYIFAYKLRWFPRRLVGPPIPGGPAGPGPGRVSRGLFRPTDPGQYA